MESDAKYNVLDQVRDQVEGTTDIELSLPQFAHIRSVLGEEIAFREQAGISLPVMTGEDDIAVLTNSSMLNSMKSVATGVLRVSLDPYEMNLISDALMRKTMRSETADDYFSNFSRLMQFRDLSDRGVVTEAVKKTQEEKPQSGRRDKKKRLIKNVWKILSHSVEW